MASLYQSKTTKLWILLSIVSFLSGGCGASRVPLNYDRPRAKLEANGPVVGCRAIADARRDFSIDEALEPGAMTAVDNVIQDEIASSGIAAEVRYLPERLLMSQDELTAEGIDLLVEPTMKQMSWEVPGYDRIRVTSFVVSFLTGIVGGLIYGATLADVYGRLELEVRLIDVASAVEETNTYVESAYEPVAKFSCDQPETKSRLIGKALAAAMEELKRDLADFSSQRALAAVP